MRIEGRAVQQALSEAEFRVGRLPGSDLRAIVRAMLTMSRSGVLVTGLDNRAKACNGEFGRIFMVNPDRVPEMAIEELRAQVYPRLNEPSLWVQNLEAVYADPSGTHSDELELYRPSMFIRRTTGPLLDSEGAILGRLWVFDDISADRARLQRREVVQHMSMFHHPDPAVVCREVTRVVADHYGTTSMLSVVQGDNMYFREVSLPPPGSEAVRQSPVSESFCQMVMEDRQPVLVQDGRKLPRVCNILPVRLGYARYLGVPLLNSEGEPVGTLCIMDSKCDEPLGAEDMEFMAVMGNRISVELAREQLFELRTQDQQRALKLQSVELNHTRKVLRMMIDGASLVDSAADDGDLIQRQEAILQGVLGFEGVKLHAGPPELDGALAHTWTLDGETYSLELWAGTEPVSDEYMQTHVSALADHIALTLATFRLQRELIKAHDDLREAQDRLVQAEKLGVVGALAATVAHDIRNIMASVALEAESDDDPAEALARVRHQVARFSVLSHRLLSYVKPKFVARQMLDVNESVRRALELLDPQIRVSRVKLSVE